jgi:hypothetical protein
MYGIVAPEYVMVVCAVSAGGCVQHTNGAFPGAASVHRKMTSDSHVK